LLKVPAKKTLEALASYNGAWRRMEYRGKFHGAFVYDDYGHHPTEIKATLAAFRQKFPHSPLICVFQPHQAKRLEILFKEFCGAFDAADATLILPLYKVLGRDERLPHDSEALVTALKHRSPEKLIFYASNPKHLRRMVEELIANLPHGRTLPSPVLIMMGAGDIVEYTNLFIKKK
jgi:UDP-N-acetylmuramate--alanine ligase